MYKVGLACVILITFTYASSVLAEGVGTKIAFDGYCNVATVTSRGVRTAYRESTHHGSCENAIGSGFRAATKIRKIKGKWLIIGVLNASYPSEEITQVLQYPLVTGGEWFLYSTAKGVDVKFVNSGTYTIITGDNQVPRGVRPTREK